MRQPSRWIGVSIGVAAAVWLVPSSLLAEDGSTLVRSVGDPAESVELDVEVDPVVLETMAGSRRFVVKDFPLPGKTAVKLDLERFEILPSAARFVVVDEAGEREVARPEMRSFRGRVTGDPDSVVVLNLFDGRIAGSIRTQNQEFVIDPRSFAPGDAAPTSVRIRTSESDPDRPDSPYCAAELHEATIDSLAPAAAIAAAVDPSIDGGTMLTAAIAIDATYEWFAHFSSEAAAQNYILNLMAQVSTIYENEVNLRFEVPYLRIFTTPNDPYTDGTTDTSTLLAEVKAEWNSNQTAIDRTAVHLFSVRPSGGAGVAYLDVLCHHAAHPGNSSDYGVSTMSAVGSSWEKKLVAHELGHNFSSPHTHCYAPEIDRCATAQGCYQGTVVQTTGTIMSYCSASNAVFHPRVEDEAIRPAAEAAYPTCMTADLPQVPPPPPQNLVVD